MTSALLNVSAPVKSSGVAYLWWFFLGTLGAHKFYLRRPAMGLLYASTVGLLGVGLLWDLFTIPFQVRQANARLGLVAPGKYGSDRARIPSPSEPDHRPDEARFAGIDAKIAELVAQRASRRPVSAPANTSIDKPVFGLRKAQ